MFECASGASVYEILCKEEERKRRDERTLGCAVAPSGVECCSVNPRLLSPRMAAQQHQWQDNYTTLCLANLRSSRQSTLNETRDETAPACASHASTSFIWK